MSMNRSNQKRSICEVLRDINDLHQGDTDTDKNTRILLMEAEVMAKKIVNKLIDYSKIANKSAWIEWENDNPNYEEDLRRRTNKSYLVG